MKTNLRWLKFALLGLALTVTSAVAQDPQYALDASRQNSALIQGYDLDNSNSALQNSAPAHQNTTEEALKKLAAQTSPAHEYGWNAACTIATIVLIACLVGFVGVLRRSKASQLEPGDLRRAA